MLQSYIVDSAAMGAKDKTQKEQRSSGCGHSRRTGLSISAPMAGTQWTPAPLSFPRNGA